MTLWRRSGRFSFTSDDENGRVEVDGACAAGCLKRPRMPSSMRYPRLPLCVQQSPTRPAYATVAYQTAWLKCFYPREYMAALLTSVLDSGKVAGYIGECERMGIKVLPPSVNESLSGFTVAAPAGCPGGAAYPISGLLALKISVAADSGACAETRGERRVPQLLRFLPAAVGLPRIQPPWRSTA